MSYANMSEKSVTVVTLSDDAHICTTNRESLDISLSNFRMLQISINQARADSELTIKRVRNRFDEWVCKKYEERDAQILNIPNFWMKCLERHPTLRETLGCADELCLYYLHSFTVTQLDSPIGTDYALKFQFRENPIFENIEIEKIISEHPYCTAIKMSTPITWKTDNPAYQQYQRRIADFHEANVGLTIENKKWGFLEWLAAD